MVATGTGTDSRRKETEEQIDFAYRVLSLEFRQALDTLTESQRKATILVCILGYRQEEAAARLGTSQPAICKALDVSMEKCKQF